MLKNEIYIVTGSTGGLGRATARELASHGATVVLNDLGEEGESDAVTLQEEMEERTGSATVHLGDVTEMEYAEELIDDTVTKHGRLDGVVNFAGILRDSYLTEMTESEWDQVIDVHLRGHFNLLRSAARRWKETAEARSAGRSFLTVASPSAFGNSGQANYSAAKAGVLGLTRTAAIELQRYDVRVNALVPIAHTQMTEAFLDAAEYPPENVAPVAAFLLSEAAAGVTGCTVEAAGDGVGLRSNPEIERIAFEDDGWSLEDLADRFEATLGSQTSLDRSETQT
mgnify:FL=1